MWCSRLTWHLRKPPRFYGLGVPSIVPNDVGERRYRYLHRAGPPEAFTPIEQTHAAHAAAARRIIHVFGVHTP